MICPGPSQRASTRSFIRFQAGAEETRNGAQIISFGCGTGDHRWTGRGVQIEASLLSSGLTGSFQDLLDAGFVAAGAGSGLGVVGWWRVREWLVRRAGVRGVSRPRWSQSRSPFALPGLFRLAGWWLRRRRGEIGRAPW